jgi:hypothetical protein
MQENILLSATHSPLISLPSELKFYVLSYLGLLDLVHIALVNKDFYEKIMGHPFGKKNLLSSSLSSTNGLWQINFYHHFPRYKIPTYLPKPDNVA